MAGTVILLVLIIISGCDLLYRIIPLSLCLIIAGAGLAWQMATHITQVPLAGLQAVGVFVLLIPVCARGMIGGGDVKLLAALAIGLTFHELLLTLFATVLAGGALGCVYLLLSYLPTARLELESGTGLRGALAAERSRIRTRESIPYGLAIAIGWGTVILPSRLEHAAWPFAW